MLSVPLKKQELLTLPQYISTDNVDEVRIVHITMFGFFFILYVQVCHAPSCLCKRDWRFCRGNSFCLVLKGGADVAS